MKCQTAIRFEKDREENLRDRDKKCESMPASLCDADAAMVKSVATQRDR